MDDYIHPIFNTGMNKHSNSSSHMWTHLRPRIFSYPPKSFIKLNCHTLVGWKENADGTTFYTPFVSILYRNYEGHPDINKAFLNQPLFNIFNVIICSPGALDCDPGSKSEVMPGAISASTIFVCFALSNDSVLQHQGSSSKIDYEADFNTYLKYLISGLQDNKQSIKKKFLVPAQTVEDAFVVLYNDDQDKLDDELNAQVPTTVEH
ncbi:hypothetical protein K439DRAFT_1616518 [Ramaria rubella]|nr:hypothetical protein K439DRAFT_1616518 [Ramaria rubella]